MLINGNSKHCDLHTILSKICIFIKFTFNFLLSLAVVLVLFCFLERYYPSEKRSNHSHVDLWQNYAGGGVADEADRYVSCVSTYVIVMALFDRACFVFYFELANER